MLCITEQPKVLQDAYYDRKDYSADWHILPLVEHPEISAVDN